MYLAKHKFEDTVKSRNIRTIIIHNFFSLLIVEKNHCSSSNCTPITFISKRFYKCGKIIMKRAEQVPSPKKALRYRLSLLRATIRA